MSAAAESGKEHGKDEVSLGEQTVERRRARVSRTVFEMNDDLWDTYQDCLERGGTAAE